MGWCFNVSFPFIRNSFSDFRDFYFQFLVLLVYNIHILLKYQLAHMLIVFRRCIDMMFIVIDSLCHNGASLVRVPTPEAAQKEHD